jgi:hypothetical protein
MTTWTLHEFNLYIKNPSMDVSDVIKLEIHYKNFTTLHENIGHLTNLQTLSLHNNK